MRLAVARFAMIVAERCMARHRRDWAQAMLREFDEAAEAGEPLRFALGCLLTAWRDMPTHEEGRFALASHVLVFGVFVPLAAVLLFGAATGQSFLALDGTSLHVSSVHGIATLAINEGNRAGMPSLTTLTAVLGIGHLHVAWSMLDQRWTRVLVAARIAAAMTATAAIFTGILFLQLGDTLPQAVAVVTELIALCMLVRWHGELLGADADEPRTTFC